MYIVTTLKFTEIKVLEMKIDQHLVWDKHVDHIAKKIALGIGGIRRIKQFVHTNTLISVFNALASF